MDAFDAYREIWAADFEFIAHPGERPRPICLVARELKAGRTIRLWRNQFGPLPPYPIDAGALFVAYYASAELGCHRALGWSMPARVLDLYTEFRDHTNGLGTIAGNGLIGALVHHGLDHIGVTEKKEMRDLIIGGGPWSDDQRTAILDYCETDVAALGALLPAMRRRIDLPRALVRGRFMAAVSVMEFAGIPIDTYLLARLKRYWDSIKDNLIADIDVDYGVYDGRTFKYDRFEAFLTRAGIPWPRLETGRLDLSDDTFREASRAYPIVSPLRELRYALSQMRLSALEVGEDGRNRTLLSPFQARSGRNQPSNTKFIFGPSAWLRALIKPPPGYGVAYIDWAQQEFGIAAALSGDQAMQAAYVSGDPYLTFAKQANAIPPDATKKSHASERDLFKTCVLGVQYGMEARSLALRINKPTAVAYDLLRAHRETYPGFWRWSNAAVDTAMLLGELQTVFGWHIHIGPEFEPAIIAQFPDAGEWGGDDADRVLSGNRRRRRSLLPCPRRPTDLCHTRPVRREYCPHPRGHGGSLAECS